MPYRESPYFSIYLLAVSYEIYIFRVKEAFSDSKTSPTTWQQLTLADTRGGDVVGGRVDWTLSAGLRGRRLLVVALLTRCYNRKEKHYIV